MSKKKLAINIFLIFLAMLVNILIVGYKMPARSNEISVEITMESTKQNAMQVFYLQSRDLLEEGFQASKSRMLNYDTENERATLVYVVPGDIQYLRFDFGEGKSQNEIISVQIAYKGRAINIPKEQIKNVVEEHGTSVKEYGTGILISAENEDPYIVWNASDWGIEKFLDEVNYDAYHIWKIVICVCMDLIFLVLLLFERKFMVIPKELWHNRKLIFQLSKNDFKTKFAGSYLGIIWAFVQPIVTVLVYWFVFEKGLKAGGINTKAGIDVPFVLWLVAGLVPWFFFQDALNGGTNALVEYSYLVKKVVFKISILPIVKVISALFVHVFFVVFTLVLFCGYHYYPDVYSLQIIYYSFAMFVLVLGLCYAASALVVFFRDLTQIINIVLQVGIWMTPIMWNIDTMELSPVLIKIFKLNPMYYIVTGYREALIDKVWFWENPGLTIYYWIVTVILFGIGLTIFKRLKVHFADVL